MKKTIKKGLITVCSLAFAMSVGVGLNAVSASAATDTVAVENNFEMVDGASIRIKGNADPSGIRWSATVTQEYYNYIKAIDAYAEFGMLVDNEEIKSVDENDSEKPIKCTATPTFDANGVWTYHASITYDKLKSELEAKGKSADEIATALQACYETELWARAYVKYTTNSVENYQYAVNADVNRSIKGVAMNCLIQENTTGNADVTPDNKAAFVTYAGGEYTTVETETVTKNAYDLTNATGTVTSQSELAAGDYAVYVGAKKIHDKVTHAGGTISTTIAGLGSTIAVKGEENNVRFINAEGKVYQVPFVSATHLISTATEFKTFQSSYTERVAVNGTDSWYVALTNDISFNTGTVADYASWTGYGKKYGDGYFGGTFDGLGHTLSNVYISGAQHGVFGGLEGATLQNLALVDLVNVRSNAMSLGYVLGDATVLNNVYAKCYAKLRLNTDGTAYTSNGVATGETGSKYFVNGDALFTVNNSIIHMEYANEVTASGNVFKNGNTRLSNAYLIGDAATTTCGTLDTDFSGADAQDGTVYTAEAFYEKYGGNFTTGYWKNDGYSLSFGNNRVASVVAQTKDTVYKTADFDIDLSDLLDGDTPEKLYVNGTATELPTGNVLTVDWDSLTLGAENTVEVWGNGKIVVQPYVAVTHVISTANDFQNFRNATQTTAYETTAAYAVLLNDIYYADCTVSGTDLGETNTGFYGIFDGLGHTVHNWEISCAGGVFGAIKGDATEIKNVAFVNLKNSRGTSTGNAGLLGGYIYRGIFSNVYVKGSFTSTHNNFGVFSRGNNRNFTNCIFDITYPTDSTYNAFGFNIGKATNVYLIGNAKQLAPNVTTAPYATASACVSEIGQTLAALSEEDYWTIQSGNLYFGNTKVE